MFKPFRTGSTDFDSVLRLEEYFKSTFSFYYLIRRFPSSLQFFFKLRNRVADA
jgi:hypothetical protein